MKKKLLTILTLAAALVACNKESTLVTTPVPDVNRPVKFSVSNIAVVETKAEAIGNGKFVAMYAGAPIGVDNVQMTVSMEAEASNGTLAPTVVNSLLWAVGQTTQETKFLAVYPYETTRPLVGDTEETKYIDYSIEGEGSVEYADHFLAAAASQAPGTEETPATVALAFKHPFAKLVYTIDNQSDDFVAAVKISGIHQNGHLMFATGAVTTTGAAVAADAPVALNAVSADSWYTVVMPESEAVNPVVTVEMVSGSKYTFRLSEGVALAAGKKYTAAIEITGTHGETVSDRTVVGTFTVTDWETVDTGDLTQNSQDLSPKWWYLSGNINKVNETTDTNWGGIIPFRCTGLDQWEIEFYYAGGTDENTNGFKLRYATGVTDWAEAWGMTAGETTHWLIDAATVPAVGSEETYVVHSLTKENGKNIRINAAGKFKIVFHPSENSFLLYKIAD